MSTPTSARDSAGSAASGLGIANIDLPSKSSHNSAESIPHVNASPSVPYNHTLNHNRSDTASSFSDYRPAYSNPSPRTRLRRPKSVNELGNSFNSRASQRSRSGLNGSGSARDYRPIEDNHVEFGERYDPTLPFAPGGSADGPGNGNAGGPSSRPDFNRFRSDYPPLSRFSPPTPSIDPGNHNKQLANPGGGRYQLTTGLPWKAGPVHTPNPAAGQGPSFQPAPRRPLGPGVAIPASGGSTPYIPVMEPSYSTRTFGSAVFPPRAEGPRKRALSEGECQLVRQGTLLTPHANSKRASAELGVMLGNSSQKANKSKLLPQGELPIEEKLAKLDQVKLEAKRGRRARVEVDVVLESETFVEGGELRGRLEVRIRRGRKGETLWIGGGKVRVCGYEEHAHTATRHIFYHYPHQLPLFTPGNDEYHPIFASPPNEDGYRMAREGVHIIPFSVRLPLGGGAKGGWSGSVHSGVRYVVVGSIKLHTPETKKRAIAHFYRPCTIYPYIEPGFVFNSTSGAAEVHTEQGLGWSLSGDKGQVQVSLKLPRPNWIAGQQVWLDITVNNKSSRKIKTMTLALLRTVTLFTPPATNSKQPTLSPDLAKYSGRSNRKKLYEHTTEASAGPGSGYVGSTGWWTGVQPGERIRWQSSLALPAECLTIVRSRLIDVSYAIRLTLNGSVHLDVPVTILNYQSIDPPPTCAFSAGLPRSYELPVEHDGFVESEPYETQMHTPAHSRRMVNSGPATYSQDEYADLGLHHPPRPPHFPLGPPLQMPETPADRRRPLSMESGMHAHINKVSFAPTMPPLPGHPGSQRSRPNSMYSMGRSQTTPVMRPGASRRDTTLSYLSAVASMEEGDLVQIEARRRAGRQASLAAIMYGRDSDDQEIMVDEEDVNVTPSTGTFAPQSAALSHEGSPDDRELSEAQQDLDFVKATSTPEANAAYGFPSPAQVSANPSSRDSESRFLEEDLQDEHAYRRRFPTEHDHDPLDNSASGSSAILRSPLHQQVTPSTMSHSVYDDTEEGDDEHIDIGDRRERSTTLSTQSLEQHNQSQPMLMPMSDRTRQAHIGATRSMYGSFAASAVSVASGPESEIGQVVEAIRRNLTMRNSPIRADSPGGEARSVDTLPEVLPNLRRYLDIPRSNSLGVLPETLEAVSRRPSAPAFSTRRPSNWSGISPISRVSQVEPYGGVWLNSPYRQHANVPGTGNLAIERSVSPLRQQTAPGLLPHSPQSSARQAVPYNQSPRNARQTTHPSGHDAPRPPSLAPPLEGYEPAPGLAPSVASDSASSQSHDDERAATPTQNRSQLPDRDSSGPLTPTHEAAREGLEVRIWRDSSSSATTSNPRHSLRSPKRLRIPSGPREKPSISPKSPYRPRYPSTEEEPLPQNPERLTVKIPEVPALPTIEGSPNKSLAGSGRFVRSPVNMSPRSASRYQDYGLVERLGQSPGKGHTNSSRRASPMSLSAKQLERQASQASMRSTSTTATQLETMLLERKGSSYVFEHSKYMQDWTGYHKAAAPYRTPGLDGEDEDDTESLSLL